MALRCLIHEASQLRFVPPSLGRRDTVVAEVGAGMVPDGPVGPEPYSAVR